MFDIIFHYSKSELYKNCPVSDFLQVPRSEKTTRPIYYVEKQVEYQGQVYLALYLSLFFMVNPGYASIGYHPADVEKVVILRDIATQEPRHVYYCAHGHGEGIWIPWDKCEKSRDNALLVYVSPASHAMYPHRGRYLRMFALVNDNCDGRGEEWRPTPADFENAAAQTWSQTHFQVIRGINTPLNSPEPAESSITTAQRIFLPLPCVQKKVKSVNKIKVVT